MQTRQGVWKSFLGRSGHHPMSKLHTPLMIATNEKYMLEDKNLVAPGFLGLSKLCMSQLFEDKISSMIHPSIQFVESNRESNVSSIPCIFVFIYFLTTFRFLRSLLGDWTKGVWRRFLMSYMVFASWTLDIFWRIVSKVVFLMIQMR